MFFLFRTIIHIKYIVARNNEIYSYFIAFSDREIPFP
jgi:hypothetical protein